MAMQCTLAHDEQRLLFSAITEKRPLCENHYFFPEIVERGKNRKVMESTSFCRSKCYVFGIIGKAL